MPPETSLCKVMDKAAKSIMKHKFGLEAFVSLLLIPRGHTKYQNTRLPKLLTQTSVNKIIIPEDITVSRFPRCEII